MEINDGENPGVVGGAAKQFLSNYISSKIIGLHQV